MTANPHQSISDNTLPPHRLLDVSHPGERQRSAYVDGLFDASARHYDWINGLMSFGSGRWYRRQALQRSGLSAGMTLLDVGCGTGLIAQLAGEQIGSSSVLAIDPSRGMLQQAQKRSGVIAVQGRGEALPIADQSFDRLVMSYALRHVTDLHTTFREYRRVLKPGGQLLLLEISRPQSKLAYYLLKGYLKYIIPGLTRVLRRSPDAQRLMSYYWDTIENCVAPETIQQALRDAGFGSVTRHVELAMFSEYSATHH